jgi:F-type H+-transporting ATPase subunit b
MATETGHAGTEAQHGPAPFPPFQPETFASQIIGFALTFGVLYLVIAKVAAPRLKGILDTRAAKIAADLSEAQKLKGETDASIAAYEKSLADARAKAQALAAETRATANAAADAQKKSVEEDLAAKLVAAEAAITKTKTEAMTHVRGIAVDTAGAIVSTLIGQAPATGDLEAAVDAALKA